VGCAVTQQPGAPCAYHPIGEHQWAYPVQYVPPDTNYRRHAYVIPGQIVKPALVFCRVCGQPGPKGEAEGEV
jgi:hypothetical protein